MALREPPARDFMASSGVSITTAAAREEDAGHIYARIKVFRSISQRFKVRNAMTKAQTTVLLELEKILQTCTQMCASAIPGPR